MATSRGDGRVPWATGIPSELAKQTYYMNAVHGDLANTEDAFRRSSISSATARPASSRRRLPPSAATPGRRFRCARSPSTRFPTTLACGRRRGRTPRTASRAARQEPVRVSVVHDNLVWAAGPCVVGHYRDDVFVGAEDCLDRQLNGRLARTAAAGSLSGCVQHLRGGAQRAGGTTTARHPGAIVVGLGTVGELTPGALTSTLTHSLTAYGAQAVGIERRRRGEGISTERRARARPRDHGAARRRRRGRRDAGGFHPGDSSGGAGGQRAVPGGGDGAPGTRRREQKRRERPHGAHRVGESARAVRRPRHPGGS